MADFESIYSGAQYDASIGKVINATTTPTSGSTNMITSGAVYTANQAALTAAAAAQSTADAALPKAGGTMTGDINLNGNSLFSALQVTMATGGRITNLSTATDAQTGYAANVAYVLAKISASFAQFASAVLAVVLTGLSTATATAIEATDTIIVALGKLQAQITSTASSLSSLSSTVSTNTSNISTLDSTKAPKADPTFTTKISTPIVQASTSGGLSLRGNGGTEVALLGAGGGTGITLAGQLNGHAIVGYRPTSTQTGTTYTFAIGDANTMVYANNASAQTYTVPPNADVAFAVGDEIEVFNFGAGIVTFAAGSGVTILSKGSLLSMSDQYAAAILKKQDDDTWILIGDLA